MYGEAAVSRQGGVTKQVKSVAERNSAFLSAAQSHPRFREVKAELQRYQRDATTRLEDLVTKSRPAFEGMVKDTRSLIQQSKDRLLIVRRGDDIDTIDRTQYSVKVLPVDSNRSSFSLGEPIRVQWNAPPTHSSKDWVGVYLLSRFGGEHGVDEARLLTTISSQGKWIAIVEDEWNGNTPNESAIDTPKKADNQTQGMVIFSGDKLPWVPGEYEVRYHHDAKHDVLARSSFKIIVETPRNLSNYEEVYSILSKLVAYALDSPGDESDTVSSHETTTKKEGTENTPINDPDDFTIWDIHQAKRIAKGIQATFDLEFTTEVIVAEANIDKLTRDIIEARSVLDRGL